MDPARLARQRLLNQHLARPRLESPAALVAAMGAVQAQDYLGSLWAVGVRTAGATESEVEKALATRAVVRTWPMRGTLHLVPAEDVRGLLRWLTPRVLARAAGRYRELDLQPADFRRARRVLVRALRGGRALTRPEAYAVLARGGVSPQGQRGIHILGHLAQEGVLCLGARRERQPTFVLLDEWVAPTPERPREEVLARLARRYFTSHGPATVHDFAWWSGLRIGEAQAAVDGTASLLVSEAREGRRWWSAPRTSPPPGRRQQALLLPPWDESIVAYKDRAALGAAGESHALSVVGRPAIVLDGRLVGTWGRELRPGLVRVRLDLWSGVTAGGRRAVAAAAARYAAFLGRDLEVR